MIRLALRDLWSRKLRTVLTMLAIVLGVAMIAGTYVLTDQIDNGFKTIFEKATVGTDVTITHKAAFGRSALVSHGTLPQSLLGQVQAVPGVAAATGQVEGTAAIVLHGKVVSTSGASTLVYSTVPARFSHSTYVAGAHPTQNGTVSVNTQFASDKHLHVGDTIGLATEQGVQQVTLSGIFNFGDSTSLAAPSWWPPRWPTPSAGTTRKASTRPSRCRPNQA